MSKKKNDQGEVAIYRTLTGNFEAVMFRVGLYTKRVSPKGRWAKFPNADTMDATFNAIEEDSYLKAWECINSCLMDRRTSGWFIGIEDFDTMAAEIEANEGEESE